eukprot:scaffold121177_cov14-Tisochrysis_lutea.AAC.1
MPKKKPPLPQGPEALGSAYLHVLKSPVCHVIIGQLFGGGQLAYMQEMGLSVGLYLAINQAPDCSYMLPK